MNDVGVSHQAAPLVAAALGRHMGVTVHFRQDQLPCTDGKAILLPTLPVELTEGTARVLWGFIHHESMHIRLTDFSVMRRIVSEDDLLLTSLLNILEDVRGEAGHIELYPGADRILRELVSGLVATDFFSMPASDSSPASLVCSFLIRTLRSSVLRQVALNEQEVEYHRMLLQHLGSSVVTDLRTMAMSVVDCTSTRDCAELAARLRNYLAQTADTYRNDALSDPLDHSGGRGESPSDSDGSSSELQEHAPSGLFLRRVLSPSADDLTVDCGDLGEALGEVLYEALDTADRRVSLPTAVTTTPHRDDGMIVRSQAISAKLSLQLKRHLEGTRRLPTMIARRGNHVSKRHLHRVALGDPRVYSRKTHRPAMNTSVLLLLDVSMSMRQSSGTDTRTRIDVAQEAVLATALALGSLRDLQSKVAAFPGPLGDEGTVEVLKDFPERVESVSGRFSITPRGRTPLSEALLWALEEFGHRPRGERRILVVITDGKPDDAASAQKLLGCCSQSGVETYALGIKSAAVRDLFIRSENIENINELCSALLSLLRGVLPATA